MPVILLPPGDTREEGRQPDGAFAVRVIEPDLNLCHCSFGLYMDEWSFLERQLANLLRNMLSADEDAMPSLLINLGMRGQYETVSNLGAAIFDESAQAQCLALMERVRSANTIRNRLAHGHWMLEVAISEWPKTGIKSKTMPYRMYRPASPDLQKALRDPKQRSERQKYMFGPGRIRGLAKALSQLSYDVSAFSNQMFAGA